MATRSVKKQNPARTPAAAHPAAAASPAPSSPPRWTFGLTAIVGAIVGLGTLALAIYGQLGPKTEAPKTAGAPSKPATAPMAAPSPPTLPATAPAPTFSVIATGAGGVAIGQMTGGNVQAGSPGTAAAQAAASAGAGGQQ